MSGSNTAPDPPVRVRANGISVSGLARIELGLIAGLLGALLVFALLLPDGLVLSAPTTDVINQFAAWRGFAAERMRAGDLPLWNPYTYGGQPFLGDFQSALLYPLNLVFLLLPLSRALNVSMLLHLLILGWGMYRWSRQRGLHPLVGILTGVILALGGAAWPRLYAGHLSNLCSMAWMPWVLASLEAWHLTGEWRRLVHASAFVALQILGGHVQYVFMTGVAAALQAFAMILSTHPIWRRAIAGIVIVYAGATALTAAQLLPGFAAASESVRQGGVDFAFARSFSLPLENVLTLAVPDFFGELVTRSYWGRWYFWETNLFVGAATFPLLLLGVTGNQSPRRARALRDLALAGALLLLAFGGYTPLFEWLHAYVPGFDRFRGMAKFSLPAMIFLALAIGAGTDAIARGAPTRRLIIGIACAVGVFIGATGLYLLADPDALGGALRHLRASGESYLPPAKLDDANFLRSTGLIAGSNLLWAAAALLIVGASLWFTARFPAARWVPPFVAFVELVTFACQHTTTARLDNAAPEAAQLFLAEHPGDHRVLNLVPNGVGSNNGFLLGASDVWGNNPFVLRRHAEFMTFLQGGAPEQASQYVAFNTVAPLLGMLRCRFVFLPTEDRIDVRGPPVVLPHALLIHNARVLSDRDAIFAAMREPGFDPRRTVLLEHAPDPAPQAPATAAAASETADAVRILDDASPDAFTIDAHLTTPAILLLTDLYSRDWRVRPLPGTTSTQTDYAIQPANYVLRAIPLAAGEHRLRIEYVPAGFFTGIVVSSMSWIVWLLALATNGTFRLRRGPARRR